MLVKMKVSMVGPNESWVPGDEREVSAEAAEAWVAAGIAELVETTKKKGKADAN